MFCHKCGFETADGSAFCSRCGAKLTVDEGQTRQTSEPERVPITPEAAVNGNTQQAPSDQAGGLHIIAGFGRFLTGISTLLLFLAAFFKLPVNPVLAAAGAVIGILLSALDLKRPPEMSKLIELAASGAVLIIAVICAFLSSDGRLGGIGEYDKYIRMVKGGTLNGYPQKTVGSAFDDFLDHPKWESGMSEDGDRIVNVKGGILYYDKETELAVQFIVDEVNETFTYNASELNGVPQNNLFFWGLLETIYNDAPASETAASQNNSGPASDDNMTASGNPDTAEITDQVLFSGIPVQDIIGMTEDEVIAKFGEPELYTEDVMDYGYDTPNRTSFDVSYGNTVSGFSAGPESFTFNGQSLNQNFDTIVTILGDTYVEQGGTTYAWSAAWYYGGCQISFSFPVYQNDTEDDRAFDISVYPVG